MKRAPDQKGLATVEFALTIVFVMIVLFWIFELIMLVYTYNVMANAAKEGVRYAIVHGANNTSSSGPSSGSSVTPPCTTSSTNVTAVSTVVQNYAKYSGHNIAGMTVLVCYLDGSNKVPNRVQVVVSYPFIPYARLGWTPPTINAAATGRIVN